MSSFLFYILNSALIVYGIIESPGQTYIMHELQPAVNYRVADLSKDSGNAINHKTET